MLQWINGILSWICVVGALAQPVWVGEPITQEKSARDMLLIVDLSGSMDEQDFTNEAGEKIRRLDAVKQVLRDFVARRQSDRLGLAVFGNAAFPQTSFTEDHRTVLTLLEELQTGMAGPRTMIGDALGLAVRLFEAAESPEKVAILLTDGNDTGSKMPVGRAAEIAAEQGVTVHTVAIGDPKSVGENELDSETMQSIADTTAGRSFLALDRKALESVYAELDKLEPQKLQTISYRPKYQLFHYALAVMMASNLLLAAIMLAGTLKREPRHA